MHIHWAYSTAILNPATCYCAAITGSCWPILGLRAYSLSQVRIRRQAWASEPLNIWHLNKLREEPRQQAIITVWPSSPTNSSHDDYHSVALPSSLHISTHLFLQLE